MSIIISCKDTKQKEITDSGSFNKPPVIMVTFSWSFSNIGDIGISPVYLTS